MYLPIIKILERTGDIGQFALPLYAGLNARNQGHKKEALYLVAAAGIQQIFLETIKYITAIPRPFPNHLLLNSFPSGHTAAAFLAVGFIFALNQAFDKGYSTAYKASFLALAGLVGVSRVVSSWHWPVDVAVGCLMGVFFGSASVYWDKIQAKTGQAKQPSQ